jgi:hypothetical protein
MSTLTIENRNHYWRDEAGKYHREDGPAVEWTNGYKKWYCHGKIHREDGPAIIWGGIGSEWYYHGKLHRNNGPSREWIDGTMAWFKQGKRHRIDGPAVELPDGSKTWWFRGKTCSQEEFINLIVQHDLKLKLLSKVLTPGSETLVDQYTL